VVFDLKKGIFLETVPKFGNFTTNISANNIIIKQNTIYIATDEGIASCELEKQLADPKSWTNQFVEAQLMRMKFKDIIEESGKIYTASNNSIYEVLPDTLVKVLDDNELILNLTKKGGKVFYSSEWKLRALTGENYPIEIPYALKKVEFFDSNTNVFDHTKPIVVYKSFGMEYIKSGQKKRVIPNSPITNYFKYLNIGMDGKLLASSDRFTPRGCMIFDGETWQNFYPELTPKILTNSVVSVMQNSKGKYFLGTWGEGAFSLDLSEENPQFDRFKNDNSPMSPFEGDYTIIGEILEDREGVLWMVNYGESTPGNVLVAMDKSSNFFGFENCTSPLGRWYFSLAIDGSGTKWVGSTSSGGLMYFNEKGTLNKTSDDICGIIQTSSYPNLPANQQNCVVVDKNDVLWIGTPYGLGSIYNPSSVIYGQKPIVRSIKALNQQKVNDIYVDAVNNKWVATNDGIWILNSDASDSVIHINMQNSPLPTNLINSIVGDENNGTIYIGTDFGLYSVSTMNVKPSQNYSITCYPQPFVIARDESLLIDGLAINSEVFITSPHGELVRRISTFSRRILWDGRDEFGQKVKSGVYLINAQSRTNNQSSVQKIAVIND
jgi:hypothetical protein